MLGLGNDLVSDGVQSVWATRFASFNGTSSKALVSPGALVSTLKGGGDIGDNVSFSMWIKATWTIPASPTNSAIDFIPFWYLGSNTDVHESMRMFYSIESGSTNKNDVNIDLRSTAPSNVRQNDTMRLHDGDNAAQTGSAGSSHVQMWDSDNTNITTNNEGFVHLVVTRGTGDWKIYWNGVVAASIIDNDSGSLNQDDSEYDSFSVGYWEYADSYALMGIRDYAVYASELSAGNVRLLYNEGKFDDHRGLITPQPVAYYPLESDGVDVISGVDFSLTNVTFSEL